MWECILSRCRILLLYMVIIVDVSAAQMHDYSSDHYCHGMSVHIHWELTGKITRDQSLLLWNIVIECTVKLFVGSSWMNCLKALSRLWQSFVAWWWTLFCDRQFSGGVDWRSKLDSQRGAVLATELKNNSSKIAKWTASAILAGSDILKFGFVSWFFFSFFFNSCFSSIYLHLEIRLLYLTQFCSRSKANVVFYLCQVFFF